MDDFDRFLKTKMQSLELNWSTLTADRKAEQIARVIGVAIGQLIRIHPFRNGNGRVSRLLWAVLLHRLGFSYRFSLLQRPEIFEYEQAMKSAMTGDFSLTIALVLDALGQSVTAPALPLPPS